MATEYILVRFSVTGELYQRVVDGVAVEYLTPEGDHAFDLPPADEWAEVVDPTPATPGWAAP